MEETSALAITEIHGVKIDKSPPQSKLDLLGVSSWKKCYARLPLRAVNCRKKKCGHSNQLRPKKFNKNPGAE